MFILEFALRDFLVSIIIFLTTFLPSNPEKLVVDTSAITSQSVDIVVNYENKTGRMVDQPTITAISEKTEEGWNTFFERPGIHDESEYIYPGGTGFGRQPQIGYWYGKPTLEPGEYKMEITYRLHESNDEVNYVTIEVPFTVE